LVRLCLLAARLHRKGPVNAWVNVDVMAAGDPIKLKAETPQQRVEVVKIERPRT
jgi:hypothetical protein